jgi:hypothetical protein
LQLLGMATGQRENAHWLGFVDVSDNAGHQEAYGAQLRLDAVLGGGLWFGDGLAGELLPLAKSVWHMHYALCWAHRDFLVRYARLVSEARGKPAVTRQHLRLRYHVRAFSYHSIKTNER